MTATLFAKRDTSSPFRNAIDASLELGAYEMMWTEKNASFRTIAARFASLEDSRPSHFVPEELAREAGKRVTEKLRRRVGGWFNLRLRGELEYPEKLRDASDPVELLYFQGWWDLIDSRSVAVVGTRKPSSDGVRRTQQLVRRLVEDDFTIVSGLADGIDTAAHEATIQDGGQTIAVIGTPLGHSYPKTNERLQNKIAEEFLLISQVPVERYEAQNPRINRFFFPERNKTMSALTEATIIVEAGETSGTLIQAREALKQGRRLFILNSCFENPSLTWPAKFEAMGAVRVREYDDIRRELVKKPSQITDLERPDHSYLREDHVCAYFGEYTARKGWDHSRANGIINNLKKHPRKRGTGEWYYKEKTISDLGRTLRANLKEEALSNITIVPAPPSKKPDDPEYDDRMLQTARAMGAGVDVRPILQCRLSREAAHLSDDRPGPDALEQNMIVKETAVGPRPVGPTILLLDDVLVTGATFVACTRILTARFSSSSVLGLFIARRVPERNLELDAFEIWDG